MKIETRVVRVLTCEKCGYSWTPMYERPKVCPKCKTYLDWTEAADQAAPTATEPDPDPSEASL